MDELRARLDTLTLEQLSEELKKMDLSPLNTRERCIDAIMSHYERHQKDIENTSTVNRIHSLSNEVQGPSQVPQAGSQDMLQQILVLLTRLVNQPSVNSVESPQRAASVPAAADARYIPSCAGPYTASYVPPPGFSYPSLIGFGEQSPRSTAARAKRFGSAVENAPPKTAVSFALFLQLNNLMDFDSYCPKNDF